MADGDGGGGEGGESAEWQPIYDRVEAQADALAADRARLEAASKVQRESWEAARRLQQSVEELQAAAREKDAENGRLQAEAAEARKKLQGVLQADARRKMRWEASYVDLLLGANQKLAELRAGDMEDSSIYGQNPNSKEVGSCVRLTQNTMDQACVASDLGTELRNLKQAYKTMSSKKDQEISALLSEKELVRNQLVIMQQDYATLVRNKKGEATQATEAAQKLQQSIDDLKMSAQKKNDEIDRLRAKAIAAEKKLHTAQKLQQSVDDLTVSAQTKDDKIERLRRKAVAAEKKLDKLQQSVDDLKVSAQTKDDEIVRLRREAIAAEKKLQTAQKLQRSVVDLKVLGHKKDDEIGRLGAEVVAAEKKLQKMHSLVKEKDDEIRRLKCPHPESIEKRNTDITETHKKSRSDDPAVTVSSKSNNDGLRQMGEEDYISERETVEKDGQDETSQKRRRVSSTSNDDEQSGRDKDEDDDDDVHSGTGSDEDGDDQSGSEEDGDDQSGSDEDGEQSKNDDNGDEQSRSDEHNEDENWQSGHGVEATNSPVQKSSGNLKKKRDACNAQVANSKSHIESNGVAKRRWSYDAPPPLCCRKLVTVHGQRKRRMVSTGNWAQYVNDVKGSLVDQPDKHREFRRFLCQFQMWTMCDVTRTMKAVLDGQPKLIRRFNLFLPDIYRIEVDEDGEEEEESIPSSSCKNTGAVAGLMKLKEAQFVSPKI